MRPLTIKNIDMKQQENIICGQTCDCTNYCKMNNPIFEDNTPPQPATVEEAAETHAEQMQYGTQYEQEGFKAGFQAGYNYAQSKTELPSDENIWQWLCKRVPNLEGNGAYKFWIKQAFEMWSERNPEQMGGKSL